MGELLQARSEQMSLFLHGACGIGEVIELQRETAGPFETAVRNIIESLNSA